MNLYCNDYVSARAAFRTEAEAAGFTLTALPLEVKGPSGEALSIDIAVKALGDIRRAIVVSSGTHGVEGYFGNAVQRALLAGRFATAELSEGDALVLIHGVNPWGFAHKRRVNEEGIDCNRNFRLHGEAYEGAPDGYRVLNPLLNTPGAPGGVDLFLPRIALQLVRMGFAQIKDAVASGQYDYPRGLFFGGDGPSTSQALLAEYLPGLLGKAERVVHLDLHTGSGKWRTYALAVDLPDPARVAQLRGEFGEPVQGLDSSGVLYTIHGALGPWLQTQMPEVQYDCMLAEFGTYNVIRVISDLRWENRAYQYAHDDAGLRAQGADKLMEIFCPADRGWREDCVRQALIVVDQAFDALSM